MHATTPTQPLHGVQRKPIVHAEAGLDFYLSSNHVLLCAKAVPVQFLKRVTREDLGPEWLS